MAELGRLDIPAARKEKKVGDGRQPGGVGGRDGGMGGGEREEGVKGG